MQPRSDHLRRGPTAARRLAWLAIGAAVALAAPAAGHVAPAIGDNNRYMKLTLLGDRIRLAYTVFYGETPGAALRSSIDTNHDGAIDEAESQAFGSQIAAEVAGSLVIAIDGAPRPVAWSQVVVGLATPNVAAGAFSIDLIAAICLPRPRGAHAVVFRDHYPLARPGETQVKIEDSPGVTIQASRIGGAIDEAHDYNLVGPSGALDTEGLDFAFTAGERAVITADGVCAALPPPPGSATGAIAAAAIACIVAGLVALLMRRRRPVRRR